MVERRVYETDLTDAQWELVEPALWRNGTWGRPREVELREVVNAIFYLVRTGCQWRFLPHDFPHPSTVRYYFYKWRDDGTWDLLNDLLREETRTEAGREPEPTAGSVDSQTVKTTEAGGERGYDGGKKVNGRKRQSCVDTMGNLLGVLVHPADWSDQEGAAWLLPTVFMKFPTLRKLWADQSYQGEFEDDVREAFGVDLDIVKREPGQRGFVVQPRRWVVERSFSWYSKNRRLSKDYERLCSVSEVMVTIASIQVMLRRLRPNLNIDPPYQPYQRKSNRNKAA